MSENTPESPLLVCARLLACGSVSYDPDEPDNSYSLQRIVVHLRPTPGTSYPFRADPLFLFAQLYGTADEYLLRVRLVRIGQDEDGVAVELQQVALFGPWEIQLPGVNYVECYGIPVGGAPIPEPGVYELQLWADGFADMLMNERFEARGSE